MGTDPVAVVGPDLRLHGLEGLRAVQGSVMPAMVSANTNATTMTIAARASDRIRADMRPAAACSAAARVAPCQA